MHFLVPPTSGSLTTAYTDHMFQTLGEDLAESATGANFTGGEKITREALEEEARQASISGQGSPEQAFWQRQRGAAETIQIGRGLISEAAAAASNQKKSQ